MSQTPVKEPVDLSKSVERTNPKHPKEEERRDGLFTSESVSRWLRGISPDSHYKVVNVLARFLLYRARTGLEADPDRLMEEIRKGDNQARIDHLEVLIDWLEGKGDRGELSYCTRETRLAYLKAVKSFYHHNMVDLPSRKLDFRGGFQEIEVSAEPTATEYLQLALRVLNSGKLSVRDRSVVLTKVQGFMDNHVLCNVFNVVAFPQLARHFGTEDFRMWDEKGVPVKVDLVRTKNNYQHYTFLDRDAVVALKEWLTVRESQVGPIKVYKSSNPKTLPKSDPIYVTRYKAVRPLRPSYISVLFNRVGKRAGVNEKPADDGLPPGKAAKRRYPFRAHEVRDTAITLARSVGVPREVVEFFAGHNIDRMGYDKSPRNDPEHFRGQYAKLAMYLNIVSGREEQLKQTYEKRLQEEVEARERALRAKELKLDEMEKSWELKFEALSRKVQDAISAREDELASNRG
jgi:integrase